MHRNSKIGVVHTILMRFIRSLSLQTLNQPDLDNRLSRNANTSGFTIQRLYDPGRKIDIYALLFLICTSLRGQIKIIDEVFLVLIKFLVKFFSFHTALPVVCGSGSQK